ncbi:hypothetical protein HPNQ4200_0926 [Helicobacter pylori NQ4200]|uniref:Uncharacterized protein n=1 Tax=Helicobacter pylori NQ4200 TaxID=992024 RepID=J0IX14_HELPX|nr:hypothetical protein HPNQ4200_0926 [Helicobacter pylori NQ4200]
MSVFIFHDDISPFFVFFDWRFCLALGVHPLKVSLYQRILFFIPCVFHALVGQISYNHPFKIHFLKGV